MNTVMSVKNGCIDQSNSTHPMIPARGAARMKAGSKAADDD